MIRMIRGTVLEHSIGLIVIEVGGCRLALQPERLARVSAVALSHERLGVPELQLIRDVLVRGDCRTAI